MSARKSPTSLSAEPSSAKAKKFTIQLSDAENGRLERLMEMVDGRTKAAAFRAAIRALEYLLLKEGEGYEFVLRKDGREVVVKLLA